MSEQKSGSSGRIVLNVAIAAVVIAALIFGIRYYTRSDVEVRTAQVETGDMITTNSTNGKVEPTNNFQAHAAEPGSVEAVYVHAGQQVAAGTLLLKLNSAAADARVETARSAIAQASAAQYDINQGGSTDERVRITGDLDRAQLQLKQAQTDVQAMQALQARGAASANEVAAAQQRLATAQSSVQSLQSSGSASRFSSTDKQRVQAQLSDSRATLAAAEQTLHNSVVRAPFAGTVYSLPIKQFDFVGAGEELVQLADLNKIQVRAYFDEPEIGKLKEGFAVAITWDARPGKTWHGHIVRTPTTVITYGTRNVGECLIAVDDATGDLLPNTNVNVAVTTQEIHGVMRLPREALHTLADSDYVYIIDHGTLVKRAVKVGALNLMYVQIESGLNKGDVVALNSVSNTVDLTEGLQVKVVKQ